MTNRSALLWLYRGTTASLFFLAHALLRWRQSYGKEERGRLAERRGRASRPRPAGALVWLHGASVGEAVALLPLIDELRRRDLQILLTTGTVTSAALMQARLPAGVIHQYVPLDVPQFVRRFLDHWKPGLALLAESELWPNIVMETRRQNIPLVLVNARLSIRSSGRWKKLPATIAGLLAHVDVTLAQTGDDAARFSALGAQHVSVAGNLKYDVPALPFEPVELSDLKARIGARPVWVAASTHEGEEAIAIHAHEHLLRRWPGLVTIIVPRHPGRGPEIAKIAAAMNLPARLRSRGEDIAESGCIYIADTIGELGLFYRAAGVVFLGRSLVRHGGQNPIEPAKLGNAILHGPNVANFADVFGALNAAGGAIEVADREALCATLTELFGDAARMRSVARAASETVEKLGGATQNTMRLIEPYLLHAQLERA